MKHPDLVGGFNRLDTTIINVQRTACSKRPDGLLGLPSRHRYPQGLGVVIVITLLDPQATWYIARGILGVLVFSLRNPYPFIVKKLFGSTYCSRTLYHVFPTFP